MVRLRNGKFEERYVQGTVRLRNGSKMSSKKETTGK